jgi:hypothetical protein
MFGEVSPMRGRASPIFILIVVIALLAPTGGWSAPEDTSLYAVYHLDEGSGTTLTDSSGNARTGVVTNGVWTHRAVAGEALDFGSGHLWAVFDSVFPFHDPADGGSDGASISFCVRPVDNRHRTIFWTREGPHSPEADANRYHIYFGSWLKAPPSDPTYGAVGVDYRDEDGRLVSMFEEPVQLNSWTRVVMTRSRSDEVYTYTLYIAGRPTATFRHPVGDLPTERTWALGRQDHWFYNADSWFNGQLDEVLLWTRTLTAEEVADLNTLVLKGFYRPVKMGAVNRVRRGRTVPLKFEVFAGDVELTDVSVIQSLTVRRLTPSPGSPVNLSTAGKTSLRYDGDAGRFIANWKTPRKVGDYEVVVTTQDGSMLATRFSVR